MLIDQDTHKYLARFIIELTSPLAVGSGQEDEIKGGLVVKDWNGLPYIPGTSILGVIRSILDQGKTNKQVFGFSGPKPNQDQNSGEETEYESQRARLGCSSGLVLSAKHQVLENLVAESVLLEDLLLDALIDLPIRDRVKIGHQGVGVSGAKFMEELVYRGTRFSFVLELEGDGGKEHQASWQKIISTIHSPSFLLGSNTRNGFGKSKVVFKKQTLFDFAREADRLAYARTTTFHKEVKLLPSYESPIVEDNFLPICISLSAKDSFLIFSDRDPEKSNNKLFKRELVVEWENDKPTLVNKLLMPGTSIKGALAHRIAYLWNKEQKRTIDSLFLDYLAKRDQMEELSYSADQKETLRKYDLVVAAKDSAVEVKREKLKEITNGMKEIKSNMLQNYAWKELSDNIFSAYRNEAVEALFGFVDEDGGESQIGEVIIDDVFLDYSPKQQKDFYHVAIDRFSGEAIQGALFSESTQQIDAFTITGRVNKTKETTKYLEVLNQAMDELASGRLPIGGLVNKGHGLVYGKAQKIN